MISDIKEKEPQTWEIVGVFLAYFEIIGDVPKALRTIGLGSLVSTDLKNTLLSISPIPDRWYVLFFTIFLFFLLFGLIWKNTPPPPKFESDNRDEAINYLKRSRRIRALRSFGLIPLREWIMDKMGIAIYGTRKRPGDWVQNRNVFKFLDRLTFNDGSGREYQYSKNSKTIIVREHDQASAIYNNKGERYPSLQDFKYLLVASWFFPFWILPHIIIRPFI